MFKVCFLHEFPLDSLTVKGWSKKAVLCNMSLTEWKTPTIDLKKIIQEFILEGLIINHYFALGQQLWPIKQIYIFCENQWKVAFYTECKKKVIVHHPAYFWLFLKAPAGKLMPHSQICFKSWMTNVGSKLDLFLWKSMVWWLPKKCFSDCLSFSLTFKKGDSLTTSAF